MIEAVGMGVRFCEKLRFLINVQRDNKKERKKINLKYQFIRVWFIPFLSQVLSQHQNISTGHKCKSNSAA